MKSVYTTYVIFSLVLMMGYSQEKDNKQLQTMVLNLKNDIRGPYKDIRWFCADGSIRAPRDPCPQEIGPGKQHARYKDEVSALAKQHRIYLGQILAYTDPLDFWDSTHHHSRLKQYQLGRYLAAVDDGWILRKAQYYRGAVQAEDEEAWGRAFYNRMLASDEIVEKHFFLIRQSMRDIPYDGDGNLAQEIRGESKYISDLYPAFMDLRIKIHGSPDKSDIEKVRQFRQQNLNNLPAPVDKTMVSLLANMESYYAATSSSSLQAYYNRLKSTPVSASLQAFIQLVDSKPSPKKVVQAVSPMLLEVREAVLQDKSPQTRMHLLDFSLKLEEILFKNAPLWEPADLDDALEKICLLGEAATGAGYLELWEWEAVNSRVNPAREDGMDLGTLNQVLEATRGLVEWSSAMVKATYLETVEEYSRFEPLSHAFIDDRIRGSLVLQLGSTVGQLGDFIADKAGLSNKVMNLPGQGSVRGLNPGFAMGELVVAGENAETVEIDPRKIYLFQRAPADMKPVAGVATVSEGNLVSHVQLLARNLGIPNAALSDEIFERLKSFHGQQVFYAVSNKGTVILKTAHDMNTEERKLFSKKERDEDKIEVPVEKLSLDGKKVLDLRKVDASDSGILCGPKAANLGELKKLFPEMVVEGLVIPFGIFRDHMEQAMPGQEGSYWQFLTKVFEKAGQMRKSGAPEMEVEAYQLEQLQILREAILIMPLKDNFVQELESQFQSILGKPIGEIAVFLRSDTNMEDLKDFTGAGLNLTLFNVAEREKVLQGVRQVWASPYTERSFKWRQRYLLNPENVFPSILVIPGVDVDYSGVLISKGLQSGKEDDATIAFSRGAGGAVEGQAAETYLLEKGGTQKLLAPSREPFYIRLPATGGTSRQAATFEQPILNRGNLDKLHAFTARLRDTFRKVNPDYRGAYDVELGFRDNQMWLFQVRPFVENKKALSSEYLESITPKIKSDKSIPLKTAFP